MPKEYTLHYFDVYARAEFSRMLLAHAKVEYEDKRYTQDEWKVAKASMPNGQLPVLELPGGKQIPQSFTIARFLAIKHGYYPEDPLEAQRADEMV